MLYKKIYRKKSLYKNKKLPHKKFKLFFQKTVYQKNVKKHHLQ